MSVFKKLAKKLDNIFFGGDWSKIDEKPQISERHYLGEIAEKPSLTDAMSEKSVEDIQVVDADIVSKKKQRKTKTSLVKSHLLEHGYIDSQTAIDEYNATRLSSIIYQLRYRHNMWIETIDNSVVDKVTGRQNYSRYILKT